MANDYRILDERDIKNFQAGNKLEVTEIGNKITYEHIGEPPNTLPSKEKVLEYGNSFNITVPSVYDSTGHVKSETKYSFIMPKETDISNFLTIDNFGDKKGNPVTKSVDGDTVIYSHSTKSLIDSTPDLATQLTYEGTFEIPALSAADGYGHATEQKTYKFQMPKAVDVSGYIKKDSFGSIDGNPVVKGENDKKQIAYSHKTLTPSPDNPPTVDLEYDKEFQFIALSATDDYGHANQNTTYKFKMPKAPNTSPINTSEFLKKSDFSAGDSLDIAKGTDNNTVTYSHKGKTITKSTEDLKPNHKGIIEITASHGLDSTGHAGNETTYNITMPSISENYCHEIITCKEGTSTYTSTLNFYDTTFIIISLQPKTLNNPEDTSYYVLPGFYTFFIPTYGRKVFSELREYSVQYFYVATANNSSTIGAKSCSITITPLGDPVNFNFTFSITLQKPELFETITIDAF